MEVFMLVVVVTSDGSVHVDGGFTSDGSLHVGGGCYW
jgi:hypothetical protein